MGRPLWRPLGRSGRYVSHPHALPTRSRYYDQSPGTQRQQVPHVRCGSEGNHLTRVFVWFKTRVPKFKTRVHTIWTNDHESPAAVGTADAGGRAESTVGSSQQQLPEPQPAEDGLTGTMNVGSERGHGLAHSREAQVRPAGEAGLRGSRQGGGVLDRLPVWVQTLNQRNQKQRGRVAQRSQHHNLTEQGGQGAWESPAPGGGAGGGRAADACDASAGTHSWEPSKCTMRRLLPSEWPDG